MRASAPAHHRSSGDLTADRRYAYARDLLAEGDADAAADLFRQTLELAPDWSSAWFGLGEAEEKAGRTDAAILAYREALTLAPDDPEGARLRLARLGALPADAAMTPAYVAALFDQYAPRFDAHLEKTLAYKGPAIVTAALFALWERSRALPGSALDLGCGTGLMAEALRPLNIPIDGVDLSAAMIERARQRGLYRQLWVEDIRSTLRREPPYSLLLAADVLVYVGDLGPLFLDAAHAITPGGLFAFTIQRHDGDGFILGEDLRYHHSLDHVRKAADHAGLRLLSAESCVTREDAGVPVPGQVIVLETPV